MSIRPAKTGDTSMIRELLEQLGYPDPGMASGLAARLERMLQDPAEVMLVWEEDGAVLGFLSLHFIPQIAVEGDFARISYFAVESAARSRGVGLAMEQEAERLARERGCHLIEVHCHERRTRAHAFYGRQGYEEAPKYLIKRL
jgi:GNAT superfamily N-acetyltransferase